jgi:hypothetical protein
MGRECENDKYWIYQRKYYLGLCTERLKETIKPQPE